MACNTPQTRVTRRRPHRYVGHLHSQQVTRTLAGNLASVFTQHCHSACDLYSRWFRRTLQFLHVIKSHFRCIHSRRARLAYVLIVRCSPSIVTCLVLLRYLTSIASFNKHRIARFPPFCLMASICPLINFFVGSTGYFHLYLCYLQYIFSILNLSLQR